MDGHETFKQAVQAARPGLARGLRRRRRRARRHRPLRLPPGQHAHPRDAGGPPGPRSGARRRLHRDARQHLGGERAARARAGARATGACAPGMRVLLAAAGSGFTWGASVVEWGCDEHRAAGGRVRARDRRLARHRRSDRRALAADGWPVARQLPHRRRAGATTVVAAIEAAGGTGRRARRRRRPTRRSPAQLLDAAARGARRPRAGARQQRRRPRRRPRALARRRGLADACSTRTSTPTFRLTRAALRRDDPRALRPGRQHRLGRRAARERRPGQLRGLEGGLIAFTKTVAVEVARRGVTVNAVAPGLIATDMTDGHPRGASRARSPPGAPGTPEEVAACGRLPGLRRRRLRHRKHPVRRRRPRPPESATKGTLMTQRSHREQIEKVITESLVELRRRRRRRSTATRELEALDIDSLDLAELSQIVEEQFGVELTGADVAEIKTVGDAIDLVVGAQLIEMRERRRHRRRGRHPARRRRARAATSAGPPGVCGIADGEGALLASSTRPTTSRSRRRAAPTASRSSRSSPSTEALADAGWERRGCPTTATADRLRHRHRASAASARSRPTTTPARAAARSTSRRSPCR